MGPELITEGSAVEPDAPPRVIPRRSLVTDILALQLAITGAIAVIALAGLAWTSSSVIDENILHWAEQWAEELNELGAPFYLENSREALVDVERFVAKYPEILSVTWYRPDGSVLDSVDRGGPSDEVGEALPPGTVDELAATAGEDGAFVLTESIERDRRFRLSGPIWVASFAGDGLFGFDGGDAETTVDLLGFVAVDLDFFSYQNAFVERLVLGSLALLTLMVASWIVVRVLLKRALKPLSELQHPLRQLAAGNSEVDFPTSRHRELQSIVAVLADTLSALKNRESHLLYLANHDPLTGLYSRHRLAAELESEIESCKQEGRRSAVCFVDLDQFKYINDTCGHSVGDQVLKLAAEQLRHSVRSDDFVARFGGDEFVVILRNVSRVQAKRVSNQVLTQMRRLSHVEQGQPFKLHCSMGVATVNSSRFSADEVIAQADMACQTAKAHGRNRVEFYKLSGKQNERMMDDIRWRHLIQDALDNDSFVLHYQPLLHIKSGVVSHYEALLRLRTDSGLIGPQAFLPAAVRFGLSVEIDRWVVRQAVRELGQLDTVEADVRISVNLSSFAFEDPSFAADVSNLLTNHSIPGDRIVFEITEQTAMRFAVETDKQIAMLRDLGCRIAIDDFGTGYSSFSYLKCLPADYVKIDGSFIRGLDRSRVDRSMVRMIGEVAKALGIETVAEYVQSADVLSILDRYGIDYAQGFYVGRAGPKPQRLTFDLHERPPRSRQRRKARPAHEVERV